MQTGWAGVIDAHTHVYPDKVAVAARKELERLYGVPVRFDLTPAGLLDEMDRRGLEAAVVLGVASSPHQVVGINSWLAGIASPRLIPFATLHPEFTDFRQELARLRELGFRGVKFHPNIQQFFPDDEAMFPIYEAIGDDFWVMFHMGDNIKPVPTVYARPHRLAAVLDRFPGLRVMAAHLGGYMTWDEARAALVGQDLILDLSYCSPGLAPRLAAEMVRAHGADRVLFGTDYPLADPTEELAWVGGLDLKAPDLAGILGGNARRILGI